MAPTPPAPVPPAEWVTPLVSGAFDPAEVPAGLPPIPPILLEGDVAPNVAPDWAPPPDRSTTAGTSGRGPGGAVWLAGCDPRTLLMGWEDPAPGSAASPQPTEWRLRPISHPNAILATGPLPPDRRFLFLEAPCLGGIQVAEIGTRSPEGLWERLATSSPFAVPEAPTGFSGGPSIAGRGDSPAAVLVRPGFPPAYFEALLDARGLPGGSASGLKSAVDREGLPSSGDRLFPAGVGAPSSDAGLAVAPTGGIAPDGFAFRVHAEVVVRGSTELGTRVTMAGRPVAIRPDGSFTARFSLPDGRFELPLEAVSPRGSGARKATLRLERRTAVDGVVGVHPTDPALRPPGEAVG